MPSANLEVKLTLNDRLRAGFRKTTRDVKRFGDRTKLVFAQINKSVLGLGGAVGALGAAITVGGIARLTASVANNADQLGKLSDRLGLTTEFLSEFRFVAEQTGVDSRTLDLALQRVTRRFGEIARTGRGTALPALKELGEDLVSAVKRGETFETLLPVIADRLNAVEDPAKRLSIAFQLFDSEGAKLVQTLGLGAEGIEELRKQADRLGLSISGDAAKAAADFNDEINTLKKTFVGFANDAILPLLPELKEFSVILRGVIADIRKAAPAISVLLDQEIDVTTKLGILLALREKAQNDLGAAIAAGLTPSGGGGPEGEIGQTTGAPARNSVQEFFNRARDEQREGQNSVRDFFEEASRSAEKFGDSTQEVNESIAGLGQGVADLTERFRALNVARGVVNDIGFALESNISSNLIAIIEQTKSTKQAFKDMARSILQDLGRIIVRALVARALGALVSGVANAQFTTAAAGAAGAGAEGGVGPLLAQDGAFIPAGVTQPAILHGPELVVPLNRQFDPSTLGGGGGTTINNFITAMDVQSFDDRINGSISRQRSTVAGVVASEARNNQALRTSFGNI